MRIKDVEKEKLVSLFRNLYQYQYTDKDKDGDEIEVTATFYTQAQTDLIVKQFLSRFGELRAQEILEDFNDDKIAAQNLADLLKTLLGEKWKNFWKAWTYNYDPGWNVDGTEKRIVKTDFGKVVTMVKDTDQKTTDRSSVTTEQIVDGTSTTTYGKTSTQNNNLTNTQTNNTTNTQANNTTNNTTNSVAPYDSNVFQNKDKSETVMGGNITTTDTGTITNTSGGSISNADSGTDSTTSNAGTVQTFNDGDILVETDGQDTDTESGSETMTDTLIRGGNIGVTKTTELLFDSMGLWKKFSFYDLFFRSIFEEVGIPVYEED